MEHDFSEIGERLDSVSQDIVDLERMEKIFLDRNLILRRHTRRVSPNPAIKPHTLDSWTMQIKAFPPVGMRSKIGTVSNELRACLDEVAYRLAVRNDASASDLERVQFPIMKTEAIFRESGLKNRIKMLSVEDQAKIEAIRPWKGANDLLYQLNAVDNMRKHRRLMVCASQNTGFRPGNVVIGKFGMVGGVSIDRLNKEYEFAVGQDVYGEMDFLIRVGFREPEEVRGQQVVPLLQKLQHEVRAIANRLG